ncbi:MAG: hypothetical protein SPL75_01785 [Bacilli bacterium]|nr:hypothetical protein [Bacilli bacterium]
MTWQELLNKWKKTGEYTSNLTFIFSEVKRKTLIETIEVVYGLTKKIYLKWPKKIQWWTWP